MPTFLRSATVAFLAFLAFTGSAVQAATPAERGAAATCSAVNPSGGDIRVFTCALPAGRAHRLAVNFSGGHDDTSASLTATLDGQPTGCDAASKTRLFGEDGDVELRCRVTAAGGGDTPHTLIVTVLWSHAQYRDFVFAAD